MSARNRVQLNWLGYLLWSVFVNACNIWLLTPLVQDYGILGVVADVLIVVIWLLGLPSSHRRRWVTFTLFSLLLGQGLASVTGDELAKRIVLAVVMCLALIGLTWWFGRVRPLRLLLTAVVLVVVNSLVPFTQWPFYTHFWIVRNGTLSVSNAAFHALPFAEIPTSSGEAVITLEQLNDSKTDFLKTAAQAGTASSSLADLLASYGNRYRLVELKCTSSGQLETTAPTVQDLEKLNPNQLNPMFPFTIAHFSVENGMVVEYFAPAVDPAKQVEMGVRPAQLPENAMALSLNVQKEQEENWQSVLQQLGGTEDPSSLRIQGGVLSGVVNGHDIDVPVSANRVVGTGSFTAPGQSQLLVEGMNTLQVVSLQGKGKVLATYHGSSALPLSNDLFVGPVDASGRDVVFVNGSPATILEAQSDGTWRQLYQAPDLSFRFETSVLFAGDKQPEIITDDPSVLQPSTTNYFTSYTYRDGNLVRNWRVYRTNVSNVQSVQFRKGGPTYLLTGIAGTGQYILLQRHRLPVVPAASVLLAIVIAAGWLWRWRENTRRGRGGETHA
jgi:hypothetical protein